MSDGEFQIPLEIHDQIREDIRWERINIQIRPMTGIELITGERLQHKMCGRTIKYDHENNADGQLAQAAAALIEGDVTWMPEGWDDEKCKKLIKKSYKERLAIAGALIAAELDRLNFKE